ncbi:MAG: hypothetical protein GWO02_07160 [Gammaproteobacteria bacterium]|nr:hypothetical protein [Gammaproteobacteria bacterium]
MIGKAPRRFVKACHVYCSRIARRAIVVALYNHAGIFTEREGEAQVCDLDDVEGLARRIVVALQDCRYEAPPDHAARWRDDWPAYRASGYRAVRRFTHDFARMTVEGTDEANRSCLIQSPPTPHGGERLAVTVPATAEALGPAVSELYARYVSARLD